MIGPCATDEGVYNAENEQLYKQTNDPYAG